MPRLTDPEILGKFESALQNWACPDDIKWTETALENLGRELECAVDDVNEAMHRHLLANKEIDQQVETRSTWKDEHEFHYDFRMVIRGEEVYVETRLREESRIHDPFVWVVNVHEGFNR